MHDYWQKQGKEALYGDLQWSRPVNKTSAGKLLIVGGNLHGFNVPAMAYSVALKAGAGTVRVVLPDALQKTISKIFAEAEYAPSTASGSLAAQAYASIVDLATWADALLLAGEFGRNSETSILIEKIVSELRLPMVVAGDILDELLSNKTALAKSNLVICPEFNQLQKMATNFKFTKPFTITMTLLKYVETLHEFSDSNKLTVLTSYSGSIFVAHEGRLSSTKTSIRLNDAATRASVWYMQNPQKKFEALTTSLVE